MYASIQEGDEVEQSEIKWSFLLCWDIHVGFFFFFPQSYQ